MTLERLPYPPRVTDFTRPFWTALDEGRLTTTRCRDCGHITFPPKVLCPDCWGRELEWTALSGEGVLRSYTEVWAAPSYFKAEVPYLLGIVDLDEGVRLLSRVRGEWDELSIDIRVELVIRRAEPVSLFEFRPKRPSGQRQA